MKFNMNEMDLCIDIRFTLEEMLVLEVIAKQTIKHNMKTVEKERCSHNTNDIDEVLAIADSLQQKLELAVLKIKSGKHANQLVIA